MSVSAAGGIRTRAAEFKTYERLRCLFCGGGSCKRCGPTAYLHQERRGQVPALPRTHSSWVTRDIVAMQRPSDVLLREGLLQAFVDNNIRCIFNLTRAGEHPHCGALRAATSAVAPAPPPDIAGTAFGDKCSAASSSRRVSSSRFIDTYGGFSYDPEQLMAAGIAHFNYSWPDMTTPPLALMRHIVEVACGELRRGHRLAVHCHAGFGRTGIAVCCVLLARSYTGPRAAAAEEAIALLRLRRPGSVQTSRQAQFVRSFQQLLCCTHDLFPSPAGAKSFEDSASDDLFCYTTCQAYGDPPPGPQQLPPTLAALLGALRRWKAETDPAAQRRAVLLFLQAEEGSGHEGVIGSVAAVVGALRSGDPSALQALLSALEPARSDGEAAAAALRMLSMYLGTRSDPLVSSALLQRLQALAPLPAGAAGAAAAAAVCCGERPARRALLLALASALPEDDELRSYFARLAMGPGAELGQSSLQALFAALQKA